MDKLDAIILAGGLGTRLGSLNLDMPKALAPVNGKPFLDILMQFLNKSGCIDMVVIAAGFKSDQIIARYKERRIYDFEINFSIEQELMGTGGAIKRALPLTRTDEILALNGDSYVDVSLKDLLKFHRIRKAAMTIVLTKVENATRYGLVRLDLDQRIISFEEKQSDPGNGFINAGVYLFNREVFNEIEPEKVLSLEREILPNLLGKQIFGYISHGKFIDIGVPETYSRASDYLSGVLVQ